MATVLVVDDRVVSTLVVSLLLAKGHKTLTAFDAVQALMQAKRTPLVDAIVLDVNMSGGSGEEMLRKLKTMSHTRGASPGSRRRSLTSVAV